MTPVTVYSCWICGRRANRTGRAAPSDTGKSATCAARSPGYDGKATRRDQVVLHGWSMGGATALRAAPGTGVAAVVEEAAYADLPVLLKGEIPDFVRFGRLLRPAILLAGRLFPDFDPWDVVPKYDAAKLSDEGVPLFIIHSTEDTIVPYEQAKILAAAYPDANVWKLEGYGHVEAYQHPEYAQRLRDLSGRIPVNESGP